MCHPGATHAFTPPPTRCRRIYLYHVSCKNFPYRFYVLPGRHMRLTHAFRTFSFQRAPRGLGDPLHIALTAPRQEGHIPCWRLQGDLHTRPSGSASVIVRMSDTSNGSGLPKSPSPRARRSGLPRPRRRRRTARPASCRRSPPSCPPRRSIAGSAGASPPSARGSWRAPRTPAGTSSLLPAMSELDSWRRA